MKANAKKLLALILAMVMCLSLAAPAMAAGGSVLETQAQPPVIATDTDCGMAIAYNSETGSFTIKETATGTDIVAGSMTDTSKNPKSITVSQTNADDNLIGKAKTAPTYKVVYKDDSGKEHTFVNLTIGTATGTTKSLKDLKDSDWTPLTETMITVSGSGNNAVYGQVQGSYYAETLSNGLWNVYFKLNIANDANTAFTDNEAYFVVKGHAPLSGASDFKDALENATECDDLGTKKTDGVVDKDAYILADSEDYRETTYQFTVTNIVDLKNFSSGSGASITGIAGGYNIAVDDDKDSEKNLGTFQVTIEDITSTKKENHYFISSDAVAKDIITKQLADCKKVAVESVTGPQGNTFTVTLKRVKTADDVKTSMWSKNVMTYNDKTAVLINDAKDGFFNGKDKKGTDGAAIAAGTVAGGPVLVRWAEVPSAAKTGYKKDADGKNITDMTAVEVLKKKAGLAVTVYGTNKTPLAAKDIKADNIDTIVFNSAAETKDVFFVDKCDQGTTIPTYQVKMAGLIGGQRNILVTVRANGTALESVDALVKASENTANLTDGTGDEHVAYTVTPNTEYEDVQKAFVTANASFVTKGSITVSAAKHGKLVEKVEETTAPTCQSKGIRTTKKICEDCKQVVGTPKVEEIPAITDPVEKNSNPDPTDSKKKKMIFDADDVKANLPKTKHYLTKAVVTTTTSEDKMTTTTTVEYYCNFNVKHAEETQTWTTTKTKLQHSGRWNSVNLEKLQDLAQASGDKNGIFGMLKSITIADSDIENENIILNRAAKDTPDGVKDTFFEISLGEYIENRWTYADGAYTYATATDIPVYESATGVPATKHYAAVIKVSDIKQPKYKHAGGYGYCDDGACVVSAIVYQIKDDADGVEKNKPNYLNAISTSNLSENLKKNKVVVVNDKFSENVVLTGTGHKYFNDDGVATELCVWCGTKKDAETPVANVIDPANVVVKDLTWTGKVAQPKVTVKDADGFALIKGTDYVVSEIDATDVGEYSITIKGLNEYAGNKFTKTFKINKAKATLKKKSAPKTLTANKKKAVTGQIKMTVKGGKVAKYKVTKKVAGVSVNKSGKITVKKNNKKAGTLKVKVTMKADKNHTAAKAVTVKVAIKAAKK